MAVLDNPAQGGDAIHYVYTDNLGTLRSVTTQSGTLVWDWPYNQNPFGEAQASGSSYTLNLRYPGQYYDQEDGLYYNLNRDYESATGRYAQPDPLGLDGGISAYAYVGGNPTGFTDPLGLSKTDRWFGFNNRDFQWWFHNCYKQKGDPDVSSREDMAEAYAEYLAAGSPPRGKCSNRKPQSCPNPDKTTEPAPEEPNYNALKTTSVLTALYWIISEGSRLFPPRDLIPVP